MALLLPKMMVQTIITNEALLYCELETKKSINREMNLNVCAPIYIIEKREKYGLVVRWMNYTPCYKYRKSMISDGWIEWR